MDTNNLRSDMRKIAKQAKTQEEGIESSSPSEEANRVAEREVEEPSQNYPVTPP